MSELKNLKQFLGKWKTTGQILKSPFGPAGTLKAIDTYKLAGYDDFILHTAKGKMANIKVASSEIIGYDQKKKKFIFQAFEKGIYGPPLYGTFKDNKLIMDGPTMRFRGMMNKKGTHLFGEWEYKKGTKWYTWILIELKRSK